MEIRDAIRMRRSIRMFRPEPVPKAILEEIIETSKWAGSPMNSQPWEFSVLGGKKMEEFRERLADASGPMQLEFADGFPLPENYSRRASEYRESSDRYHFPPGTEDVEKKREAFMAIRNRLTNAPNVIIIYSDSHIKNWPWGFFGIGIIAQTVCLAALAHGLGTCILGGPAGRPNIARELCGISKDKIIICAIAIGYPDMDARINNFPRTRMPINEWVKWHGF